MPPTSVREKLIEQNGFLKRSVATFLDGHREEALRVATTIRVLLHETCSSKPLLKQLASNYLELTILDNTPPTPARPGGIILMWIGVGVVAGTDKGVQPIVDLSEPNLQLTSLGTWWNQKRLIFTDEKNNRIAFTRREILLTLANKEGGAHVDPNLPIAYEKYAIDSPLKIIVNGIETDTVNLSRFIAIQSAVRMIECLERNFPWIAQQQRS